MLLTDHDLSALSTALRQCEPLDLPRTFGEYKVRATVCPASPAWSVAMLIRIEVWWPGWYMSKYCESVEEVLQFCP